MTIREVTFESDPFYLIVNIQQTFGAVQPRLLTISEACFKSVILFERDYTLITLIGADNLLFVG